jgi:probable HAF family extracellular repeat protein
VSIKNIKHIAFVVGFFIVSPLVQADSYTVTQLGGLGGTGSQATGINDNGQVVGTSIYPNYAYGLTYFFGVSWQPSSTTPTILGSLGGVYTTASGINASGVIIGYSNPGYSITGSQYAIIWQQGSTSPTTLNGLGGTAYGGLYSTSATAINSIGQVVGNSRAIGGAVDAVIWQPGSTTPTILNGLGGTGSQATGINDNGQVVGQSFTSGNANLYATLWQSGKTTPTILYGLGAADSNANGINTSGQVVGYSDITTNQAVLWQSGSTTPTTLNGLGGSNSVATAINASGEVVGYSNTIGNLTYDAALWLPGSTTAVDLNTLVSLSSGVYLTQATGINTSGQIIANGSNGNAYLLTPNIAAVPVPPAFWLFGSALVGFIGRNRQKSKIKY